MMVEKGKEEVVVVVSKTRGKTVGGHDRERDLLRGRVYV